MLTKTLTQIRFLIKLAAERKNFQICGHPGITTALQNAVGSFYAP